ncbi:MAG: TRAP transporter small permease [Natronospirillum sp.]
MNSFLHFVHRLMIGVNGVGAGLTMVGVFVLVFTNAVWRYGAGRGIVWAADVAVFLMIFGIMFGAALAYLQERHVRFTIVMDLIPPRWQAWNVIFIDLVVLAVGIGLMMSGWEFMESRGRMRNASTGLRMWVFQSSMVMGGGLLTLSALIMAARHSLQMKQGEATA